MLPAAPRRRVRAEYTDLGKFALLVAVMGGLVIAAMVMLQPDAGPRVRSAITTELEREAGVDEAPSAEAEGGMVEEPAPPEPEAPPPSEAPIVALRISRVGIDAPIVVLGVDAQGVMETPAGPRDVAWYDFTAHPGFGSNAVFAGHVDYRDYGPAVFWRLREVREGDEIEVALEDGTSYLYKVTSAHVYGTDEAPVEAIVGPTETESITLITCEGTFNTRTREYDRRLVVRAELST